MDKPYKVAKSMYEDGELEAIIAFCMEWGVVVSNSDYFLCMYPTCMELIGNKVEKDVDKPNTWYVYIATGDIKQAFNDIKPMDFVAFRRFDENFRVIKFEKLRKLLWATSQISGSEWSKKPPMCQNSHPQ